MDFILGQYDEEKGVLKKGLTFVFKLSLIKHIPFAMLDCEQHTLSTT